MPARTSANAAALAAFLAAALALVAPAAAAQEGGADARIAVASAFPPELAALLAATEGAEERIIGNVAFTTGRLEGREVVLFLSGVSMVNAAMTTQMALDHFEIARIVFSGIAGGVDPDLSIGDVVVAERWAPYFDMHVARETGDGYAFPPFFQPSLPGFGAFHPRGVRIFEDGAPARQSRMWFEVPQDVLAPARRVAEEVALEACAGQGACLDENPRIVVGGSGVSGTLFVDNARLRRWALETFDARVLDMESAAVAQVAATNGVPFIAFRSLSDLAGGGEGANEMEVFLDLAAGNAARAVRAYLAALDGS